MSIKVVEPSVDFLTTGLVGPGVQKISLVRNDFFANTLKGKRVHERKPTRFSFVILVGVKGFEPSASWSQTRRASQLRHTPLIPPIIYS